MSTATEKLAAQFSRTYISESDFREADDYLGCYAADSCLTIQRALLVSAIVAYARPFTANKGGAKATASVALDLESFLSSQELALHSKLLALRHQALAHSDYSLKAAVRVNGEDNGFVVQARLFDVMSEYISVPKFRDLCTHMKVRCTEQLRELNQRLVSIETAANRVARGF